MINGKAEPWPSAFHSVLLSLISVQGAPGDLQLLFLWVIEDPAVMYAGECFACVLL